MREASFILPLGDDELHQELVTVLVLRFGGCLTADVNAASAVRGLLRTDPSREYRVAFEWYDGTSERDLLALGKTYATRAGQATFRFKTTGGTIINTEGN